MHLAMLYDAVLVDETKFTVEKSKEMDGLHYMEEERSEEPCQVWSIVGGKLDTGGQGRLSPLTLSNHSVLEKLRGSALIINALRPLSFCKNASPTFSMVHLLHRLYGVDAPAGGIPPRDV